MNLKIDNLGFADLLALKRICKKDIKHWTKILEQEMESKTAADKILSALEKVSIFRKDLQQIEKTICKSYGKLRQVNDGNN